MGRAGATLPEMGASVGYECGVGCCFLRSVLGVPLVGRALPRPLVVLHVQCQSIPFPTFAWEFSLPKSCHMPADCKSGRNSIYTFEVIHFPTQNGFGQWSTVLSFKQQFYVTDGKQNGESAISCRVLLNFEHE